MPNRYDELRNRQQEEANAFPIGAAFSNKQFREMMEKWGLTEDDTDKILSIGAGCYIRKTDQTAFHEMFYRHQKEREEAIAADETGEGFIYEMFLSELNNHEYSYTGVVSDAVYALGFTFDQIGEDERLRRGLMKAMKEAG